MRKLTDEEKYEGKCGGHETYTSFRRFFLPWRACSNGIICKADRKLCQGNRIKSRREMEGWIYILISGSHKFTMRIILVIDRGVEVPHSMRIKFGPKG